MDAIEDYRSFYARFVVYTAGSSDERLIAAFAAVPREDYLGPGPWAVSVGSGYISTVSDDPRLVYQDMLIGLATDRRINNGRPSLHARCLHACSPRVGEKVVHVGAGTGYYTAVLAHLVGTSGRVSAFEIEPDLAERARDNLRGFPNVSVTAASAVGVALPPCDLVYVNAGATHPLPAWLDALTIGGRLIFPMTSGPATSVEGTGCMLLVTRASSDAYAARILGRVAFIPCIGARDEKASAALAAALESRSMKAVRSLRRDDSPDSTAWCAGSGWWLSTAEPPR